MIVNTIKKMRSALLTAFIFLFMAGPAFSANLSRFFSVGIDPSAKEIFGDKIYNGTLDFFHKAESAIESEDLNALMALYSDSYKNGDHDKASIKKIWARIFKEFDDLSTMHNMRFVVVEPGGSTVIIQCSGLLMGIPKGKSDRISVDTWTMNDHILILEPGGYKIIGTTGKPRKRLWFDKALHPLF